MPRRGTQCRNAFLLKSDDARFDYGATEDPRRPTVYGLPSGLESGLPFECGGPVCENDPDIMYYHARNGKQTLERANVPRGTE